MGEESFEAIRGTTVWTPADIQARKDCPRPYEPMYRDRNDEQAEGEAPAAPPLCLDLTSKYS